MTNEWVKDVILHGQPASGGMFWCTAVIDCTVKLPPHCFRLRPDYTCFSNLTCFVFLGEFEGWIHVCVCMCVCLTGCAYDTSYTFCQRCVFMMVRRQRRAGKLQDSAEEKREGASGFLLCEREQLLSFVALSFAFCVLLKELSLHMWWRQPRSAQLQLPALKFARTSLPLINEVIILPDALV